MDGMTSRSFDFDAYGCTELCGHILFGSCLVNKALTGCTKYVVNDTPNRSKQAAVDQLRQMTPDTRLEMVNLCKVMHTQ